MATLGKTSHDGGGDAGWAGFTHLSGPYTATEDGTITAIVFDVDGVGAGRTDQVFRGVVQVGATIGVATLLATGAEVTGHAATAETLTSSATGSFTAGQKLWIGAEAGSTATNGCALCAAAGASGDSYYKSNIYPTAPANMSGASAYTAQLDAYIVYTPASASPPVNTVAPAVTGTTTVGQTLSCSTGTWTDGTPVFTYQWQRDVANNGVFSNIAAATANTYALVDADDGNKVRCVVTDTDENGATSANSNAVGLIIEPVPTNSVAPVASGTAKVGSAVSSTTGTWTHQAGSVATYLYQWQDSADGSTGWANIAAATSATYAIAVGELTKFLRCNVTAHNSGGDAASATPTNVLGAVGAALPPVASTNTSLSYYYYYS